MPISLFHRNNKGKSDAELLDLFLKTDNQEFLSVLYERYIHLVYGVCLKYFREREKSQDAVIEIYEKIQHEIKKHNVVKFKSWLYVVTKNHCLMQLRNSKQGQTTLLAFDKELDAFMENEENLHPVDSDRDENQEKALKDCIEKLKDEQRMCIHLFYYKGKSYREVAAILKNDVKKVKSDIQNGKRNLKICLERKK